MPQTAWHDDLKATVPRDAIGDYLVDLQALVSGLRRFRDDLVIPTPSQVAPLVTDRLRRHPSLTLGYLDDARYRDVVAQVLAEE